MHHVFQLSLPSWTGHIMCPFTFPVQLVMRTCTFPYSLVMRSSSDLVVLNATWSLYSIQQDLSMSHLLFYLCSSFFPFPPSHLSLAFLLLFSPLKDNHMWLLCVACRVCASPIHTSHSVSCFASNAISLKLGDTNLLDPDHSHTFIHPKLPSHASPWWSCVVIVLLCCLYYAPILL